MTDKAAMPDPRCRVGVISDTHGLLRPEALSALNGSDRIVHAGDIGDPEILTRLAAIAPVTAVRGNTDREPWTRDLPETAVVDAGDHALFVIHDLGAIDLDPAASGFRCVISGHSHRPAVSSRNGVTYLNPGSAGRRRFDLPVSVARIDIDGNAFSARLIELGL
jgi:putative phosphoesterase